MVEFDSTKLVATSVLYLIFFAIFGMLSGVGTFPPPPFTVSILWWSFTLSFWQFTTLVVVLGIMITALIVMTFKLFGSGVTIPQVYIATIVFTLSFMFYLGWIFNSMFNDIPILFQAILVWPFLFIMAYAIIKEAGKTGEK